MKKQTYEVIKGGMEYFVDLLYPRRCPLCQTITKNHALVCEDCEKDAPYVLQPYCMKCGKPMRKEEETKEYCFDCIKQEHVFERNYSLFVYETRVKQSIYQFKYHNKREFADWYAKKLFERYQKEVERMQLDGIVPVPIHKKKRRQRGYNQAELISRQLSNLCKIPHYPKGLIRTLETVPQKELNNKQRYQNLRQAFSIGTLPPMEQKEQERTILLVDDIYTTGATLDACATVLLEQRYATKVYGCTIGISKGF